MDLSSQPSTLACAHPVPALPDGLALALALGAVGRCVHCFMGVLWVFLPVFIFYGKLGGDASGWAGAGSSLCLFSGS